MKFKRSISIENIEADYCLFGKEGLKNWENTYQLVILDVMMLGTDGFETLAQIRAKNNLPVPMVGSFMSNGFVRYYHFWT